MSLIRNAIRSTSTLRSFLNPSHGLPFFLRDSPKRFSAEADQPPSASPPPSDDPSVDPFLRDTGSGLVYGKLLGITKHTLKTDVMNLLEGLNLTPDDVKVSYNRDFFPFGMMIQFPSRRAFDSAIRTIGRKGRLYRLEKVDRSQWDILMPYDGKTVLLQGIPLNAQVDDIERFLSGCDFDPSSLQTFVRPGFPDPVRLGTVRFPSRPAAMNALITKNRGFCLNNQVLVRVLE